MHGSNRGGIDMNKRQRKKLAKKRFNTLVQSDEFWNKLKDHAIKNIVDTVTANVKALALFRFCDK